MPKVFVSRSQVIEKPLAEVFARVRQFETWPQWLPWLVAAPGFEVEFLEDGLAWSGRICGEGRMHVLGAVENEGMEYELVFTRPRKMVMAVSVRLLENDGATKMRWSFAGKESALQFWRKWSRQAALGEEWERGLAMFKDRLETGVVPSRLEYPGREGCPPFAGVGIRRSVKMADLEEQREADQREVRAHYPEGEAMTVYEKRSLRRERVVYLTGVRLERRPGVVADGMELFEFPGSEVYTVRHFGDLRYLGNGWAGGSMHLRAKRLKADKKLSPFELYQEEMDGTPVVRICLPLR